MKKFITVLAFTLVSAVAFAYDLNSEEEANKALMDKLLTQVVLPYYRTSVVCVDYINQELTTFRVASFSGLVENILYSVYDNNIVRAVSVYAESFLSPEQMRYILTRTEILNLENLLIYNEQGFTIIYASFDDVTLTKRARAHNETSLP